jgi:hypothetical protein
MSTSSNSIQEGRFNVTIKVVNNVERKLNVLSMLRKDLKTEENQCQTFFIHGAGGRIKQFESQMQHLIESRKSDCIAFDFIGIVILMFHGNCLSNSILTTHTSLSLSLF